MNQIVLTFALPLLSAFLLPIIMRASLGFGLWIGPVVLLYGSWLTINLWLTGSGDTYSIAMGGFAPPVGINFYIDEVSLLLVFFTQLMGLLFWPYKISESTARRQVLMLLLVASSTGMALSGDLFNLYVFYELVAVASFGLIAASNTGASYAATLRYLILSGVGAVLILVGVAIIYSQTGTLNLAHLAQLAPDKLDNTLGLVAFLAILIGVGVKAELFPVNTWVPEVYATAESNISAILAGLVSKLAVLIIVRLMVLIFQQPEAHQALLILGVLGVLGGELAAWRSRDMNRMLAYSSIGQLGMIFIAFGLPEGAGLAAGLALTLHHLVVKPGLFMLATRWGGSLQALQGGAYVSPLAAGLFLLFALSLVGVPPLPGFWAKYLVVTEMTALAEPIYAFALFVFLSAAVVESSYLFQLGTRLFKRPEKYAASSAPQQSGYGLAVSSLLGASLVIAVIFIAPLGEALDRMAVQTGSKQTYIQTVFPVNEEGGTSR